MATITPTTGGLAPIQLCGELGVITWTPLANGDAGASVTYAEYADKTVQVHGTFGAGGSIQLEGSNDNTNWFILSDPQGNNIVKTAAAMEAVEESPLYVRPRVTAGDGTTALTCILAVRRGRL